MAGRVSEEGGREEGREGRMEWRTSQVQYILS